MGKASSAKKVARAARAGGRVSAGQPRSLLFPGVIALVFVLGFSLVLFARSERQSQDVGGPPQLGDHMHAPLGVNVCGEWLPDLPSYDTRVGIHSHGDGIIHMHPFSRLGTGTNSTLGRYFQDARDDAGFDVALSDDRLEWLGQEAREGTTECDGVDDPQLRVAHWDLITSDAPPRITTGGFGNIVLDTDGAGITIFYGDPDADIPKPPSAQDIAAVSPGIAATPEGEGLVPDELDQLQQQLDHLEQMGPEGDDGTGPTGEEPEADPEADPESDDTVEDDAEAP